jgi:two-component sensor histidine kinase
VNSVEKLVGKKVNEMLIADDPHNIKFTKEFIENNYRIENYESHEIDSYGNPVFMVNNASGIIKDNKLIGVWGTQTDVTQRKIAEDKLLKSLQEKEVLLKEIHHRVKNNLQIVSSLLKLQSSYIKDKKMLEILKDSQERVASMAFIHQKLYQSKDLAHINFADYLKMLTSHLIQSFGASSRGIQIKLKTDDIDMSIDDAVPCGLIINELVTNSFRHAFPDEQRGIIEISVKKEKGKYELFISDNGIGMKTHIDVNNAASFGLKLVNTLVKQLKGEIKMDHGKGTSFRINFAVMVSKIRA